MFLENSDVASESEIETKAVTSSFNINLELKDNNNTIVLYELVEINSTHVFSYCRYS